MADDDSKPDRAGMPQTEVVIGDPQTRGGEWEKYTDYEISVKSSDIAFSKSNSVVRRRYSEFAWLASFLKETVSCTEVDVPELPPKKIFNRFKPEFIEERRAALEQFLKKLLDEPQFLSQRSVHLFLQSNITTREIERFLNDESPLPQSVPDSTLSPTVIQCTVEALDFDFKPPEITQNIPSDVTAPNARRPSPTSSTSSGFGSSCEKI